MRQIIAGYVTSSGRAVEKPGGEQEKVVAQHYRLCVDSRSGPTLIGFRRARSK